MTMRKSDICVNCICLPVCRNKTGSNVVIACDILVNSLFDVCRDLERSYSTTVKFAGLNMTFHMSRNRHNNDLVVQFVTDHNLVLFDIPKKGD